MPSSETGTHKILCEASTIEALASALDIAIMIYDRNDTLTAGSSNFLKFFNVSPRLIEPGARLRDLFSETFDAGAAALGSLSGAPRSISREDWISERIALHWRERYESVEKLPDGRWLKMVKRRMPDGILIATCEDVTEQKRRDAELIRSRHKAELAQHILDNLVNPVIVKDSDLRYVIVNDAFCRIPGLHPRQVLGRTARELVEPELADRFETAERHVLETGEPFDIVEDIYRSDGSVMHVITRARRSGTAGNYYVTVSFDDISDFVDGLTRDAAVTAHYDIEMVAPDAKPPEDTGPGAQIAAKSARVKRVLVVDEDATRAEIRVQALKAGGGDAVALARAGEVGAFLKALRAAGMEIDEVELTAAMARELARQPVEHPVLIKAIEQKLAQDRPADQTAGRTADTGLKATPAETPTEPAIPAVQKPSAKTMPGPAASSPELTEKPEAQAVHGKNIRILVAEDNDVNQIVFEQILEGIGVDYRIVSNGQEAVAAWRASPPDLILMDISMPVMNGLQATQAIREAEAEDAAAEVHVPIIAVTAHAMTGDRERCFAAGMDDYLSKPISPEKLESIVRKWIDFSDRLFAAR